MNRLRSCCIAAFVSLTALSAASAQPEGQGFKLGGSNQPPTITLPAELTLLEDGSGGVDFSIGDDATPPEALVVIASSSNQALISDDALSLGLSGLAAARQLDLQPASNANGTAIITVNVSDGAGQSREAELVLTVLPVNDPPSAGIVQNPVWPAGESGQKLAPDFVASTSPGPSNESGQTVNVELAIDSDPSSILAGASIEPDGSLRYQLTGNSGAARLRLQAVDDGGTANGGIDRGEVQTRRIIVGPGVDISLRISRGQPASRRLADAAKSGSTLAAYTVEVRNNSPEPANGLRVQVSPILGLNDVLWICVISDCTPNSGSGPVDAQLDLIAGGVLLIGVSGSLDPTAQWIEISARASLPQGTNVLLADDDTQVFIEAASSEALHKSGFE